MAIIPINPIPVNSGLYSNIQPFTVRENATFINVLEEMRKYINGTLVPFVNTNVGDLDASWNTKVNELIEAWNTQSDEIIAVLTGLSDGVENSKDAAEAAQAAAEAARDLAELYASQAEDIQDDAIAARISDTESDTRAALDGLYAASGALTSISNALDALTLTVGGKASQSSVDAISDDVSDLASSVGTLEGAVGDLQSDVTQIETDLTGYPNLAQVRDIASDAASGLPVRTNLFDRLKQGVLNPALDTRVVFSGSSTSQGMSSFDWNGTAKMGVFQRLASLSGAVVINDGPTQNSVVGSGPMRWWQFAGSASADYMTAVFREKVENIQPNYVFHMIGSNDWSANVPLATYKANVLAAVEGIEATVPAVINVLIHQQPRRDGSRAIPWHSYGQQLSDIADMNPGSRVFVNLEELFLPFDIVGSNRTGLVMPDNIHMGNVGHKLAADYLARLIGIPTPADFAAGVDYRELTFQASGEKAANTEFAAVAIESANYPRLASVSGQVFARGAAAIDVYSYFKGPSDLIIGQQAHRLGIAGVDIGVQISNNILIPPHVAGSIVFRNGGGTLYVSGAAGYANGAVALTAA